MQIGPQGEFHLTYCTKVHPGHGWEQLSANLRALVPALKARLAPTRSFGLGLRLAADEADELLAPGRLETFKEFLAAHDVYVFTLNGFPYGNLEGPEVKEQIFAPDWRQGARLTYTLKLIEILRRLLPAGGEGSISTLPLSYKAWIAPDDDASRRLIAGNLAKVAAKLVQVGAEDGLFIHLDLEPEPDGLLENSGEVVGFYRDWLLQEGAAQLSGDAAISLAEARRALLRHLQICLDTCHLAVAFEEPEAALAAYSRHGIRIGKVQVTSGLELATSPDPESRAAAARQLQEFSRSPYLHQVAIKQGDGGRCQFRDLAEALPLMGDRPGGVCRIHYHMPLYVERHRRLASTAGETRAVLRLLRERGFCRHLEIETYTWEWLPAALKLDLPDSLHREYLWVLEAMGLNIYNG